MDIKIVPVAYRQMIERDIDKDGCEAELVLYEIPPSRIDLVPDGAEMLYPQYAIDSLRSEVDKWKSIVIFGQDGLTAHVEQTEADIRRLVEAANKWSERELLFGAHEDLQARAERAEAEAAEWKQRWIGAKAELLIETSGYMDNEAVLKAEECANRLTLLDGAKRAREEGSR